MLGQSWVTDPSCQLRTTANVKAVGTLSGMMEYVPAANFREPPKIERLETLRRLTDEIQAVAAQHVIRIVKEPFFADGLRAVDALLNDDRYLFDAQDLQTVVGQFTSQPSERPAFELAWQHLEFAMEHPPSDEHDTWRGIEECHWLMVEWEQPTAEFEVEVVMRIDAAVFHFAKAIRMPGWKLWMQLLADDQNGSSGFWQVVEAAMLLSSSSTEQE